MKDFYFQLQHKISTTLSNLTQYSSMKLHANNEGKIQLITKRKTSSKIAHFVAVLAIIATILPIYYTYIRFILQKPTPITSPSDELLHVQTTTTLSHHHHPPYQSHLLPATQKQNSPNVVILPKTEKSRRERNKGWQEAVLKREEGGGGGNKTCDLFSGEWVENPKGPYYTNETCFFIQEHQNCMKFGRPDQDFLKWRWKPYECELPVFDPVKFLEMMRGKSLAFVGDSIARNHMQSLLCLLSRVAYPNDALVLNDQHMRWEFPHHNFNISLFWSPYLVNIDGTDRKTEPFNLYLDEFDDSWTSHIQDFNYVIISAGQWFFRPTMFYSNRSLIGCLYCPESNVRHHSNTFGYRRAWRTVFRAINNLENFKGVVFVRTFSPSHFEGGPWNKGGDCVRKRPLKSGESVMEDFGLQMYNTQMQEYKIGEREGRRRGVKITLMDMTGLMQMRPDGHPSKYGHEPAQYVTMPNDCVHWCLPGPIDAWSDFLMELIKREGYR